MDKRWIFIFIILIVGISSLYLITDDSMRIGKAITTIENVIVTLPTDFKVNADHETSVELVNRNTDEKILVELINQKNKAYSLMKSDLQELKNENVDNIKNKTQKISNITTYTISYQNLSSNPHMNYTVNYINKLNKTFIISTYDYNDNNSQMQDLKEIINTLRIDFKQKEK